MEQEKLDFLKQFDRLTDECTGRVKWAAKNAIKHLRMAAKISDLDQDMASFRAVCAEEEAATALIASLQQNGYPKSKLIRFRTHEDKHAVIVFVQAAISWFGKLKELAQPNFGAHRLYFGEVDGRIAMHLGLQLGNTDIQTTPIPPLHLIIYGGKTLEEIFESEINQVLGEANLQGVRKSIGERANFRNKILYATPDSMPSQSGDIEAYIMNQAGIVNALLIALALVDPWSGKKYPHSQVVVSLIDVFARMMERVRE